MVIVQHVPMYSDTFSAFLKSKDTDTIYQSGVGAPPTDTTEPKGKISQYWTHDMIERSTLEVLTYWKHSDIIIMDRNK